MRIGVCSANSGPYTTRDALIRLSEAAEKAGIDSIWVSEHLVVPDPKRPPSNMDPKDPILDPVTSLAFLAARTESVRLGTGIIVLPLRNPLILAKELATVDVLSGGRLVFGIGVGYVEREFDALDAPFGDRGVRTEEYLAAIRAIWTQPRPAFDARTVSFSGVQAFPHPVQRPHPPIVMGGYAAPVMRRTIREADGWYGWGMDLDATGRRLAELRETASRVPRGEGLGPLEITITPPGDVDLETAARYAALGVDRLNLMLPWEPGRLDNFFERVVQPLVDADPEPG
ncbi:MAG TPA: LLM class F420-dependent oxidoreductase [Actinomycetota bacterium]|nr:LLM class F420-dependent oxidoreductase [Actinomycetota bacterium]